ncbi:MAG: phosphomannomutase [Actinomycetota bacterium]|nr:phosphomannomutase [Actinomycetota bacterium]
MVRTRLVTGPTRRLTKRDVEVLLLAVERAGDDGGAVRALLADAGVPPALLEGDLASLFDLVAMLNETRRVPIDPGLDARARAWLEDDPDPETRAALSALIEAGDEAAIAECFHARLGFGTAGIRGAMGAGPNRMNASMVRSTIAGIAACLTDPGRGVVVGHDGRRRSDAFAIDAARVLSGAGVPALVLPGTVPTPVLAFAVQHLRAAAGVMITASHNPPNDNGVKFYGGDGAQIVPPADGQIAAAIDRVGPVRSIPLDDTHVRQLDGAVLDAYLARAATVVRPGPRDVRVVHTALHGVGWEPARRLFRAAGFAEPVPVAEQMSPDATFPTVTFPNPEEPGALDLALALAARVDADVVVANDPDADRLGVAVPDAGGWRQLTGDEIGVLLAERLLDATSGDDRLVACSLVSSTMLRRMAAAHGVHFVSTLPGFKWIARAAERVPGSRFVFGYEEALGYSVGDVVRDKDGLTAALAFVDLVAALRAAGRTVPMQLEALARRYGLHATLQWSTRASVTDIDAAVARMVDSPPRVIAGRPVTATERPADDIVVLHLEGDARVVVRPSGTEPKLKTYFQVVIERFDDYAAARLEAADQIESLRRDVATELGLRD